MVVPVAVQSRTDLRLKLRCVLTLEFTMTHLAATVPAFEERRVQPQVSVLQGEENIKIFQRRPSRCLEIRRQSKYRQRSLLSLKVVSYCEVMEANPTVTREIEMVGAVGFEPT